MRQRTVPVGLIAEIYPTYKIGYLGSCRHGHLKEITVMQCEGVGLLIERRDKRYIVEVTVVSESVYLLCIDMAYHQIAIPYHIILE